MKVRVRVIFPSLVPGYRQGPRKVKEWYLSTESSASSYAKPVLVDEDNNPYGPADLPSGTIIRVQTKDILAAEGARLAGYTVEN